MVNVANSRKIKASLKKIEENNGVFDNAVFIFPSLESN